MRDLTATPNLARFQKSVHREICGRPFHTFKTPYVEPTLDAPRFSTVAVIQSGGVTSHGIVLTEDWTAMEPDAVIFLDDELKVQKPSEPRAMSVEESAKHYALKGDYVASIPPSPSITVLHQKIVKALSKGVPALFVAKFLQTTLNKTIRLFKGYSTEYRAIVNNVLTTYQVFEND